MRSGACCGSTFGVESCAGRPTWPRLLRRPTANTSQPWSARDRHLRRLASVSVCRGGYCHPLIAEPRHHTVSRMLAAALICQPHSRPRTTAAHSRRMRGSGWPREGGPHVSKYPRRLRRLRPEPQGLRHRVGYCTEIRFRHACGGGCAPSGVRRGSGNESSGRARMCAVGQATRGATASRHSRPA